MNKISLVPLRKALMSLKKILAQPMNEFIRDGAIQRFEFTFELSWKIIKKYLKSIGREDISSAPRPIIREAGKEGLILDVHKWFEFLEARNQSTHVYNENEANEVFSQAKLFPTYVDELILILEKKDEIEN